MNDETLFHLARGYPPTGRLAFLEGACGGDAVRIRRILDLVEADGAPGGLLEGVAAGVPRLLDFVTPLDLPAAPTAGVASPPAPVVHDLIGPYKLLQKIGEGGMGMVWMAEQRHPVQRRVALKVIRPGAGSRQALARFEVEQRALALMDHPNIATVFDAGITESGVPYFVMELVKGVPITAFCDERKLTPRERVALLLPVCHAVQHAHRKGVIHRDLKPSNLLVALHDDVPVPKVIDFGVAKATERELTERTFFTEFGTVLGTLEYMSPEQAQLNQLDIDTRSDVYALGVILYELLTGTTPIGRARLERTALLETLRVIRDEDPPTPSTRIGSSAEIATIADRRSLPPHELRGVVQGELDWIVMRALEKDRNLRYESPAALAADLHRYLHDEPVAAGPPSRRYRLRKFARKHRAALLVAGTVFILLIACTVVSLAFALRATDESAKKTEALRAEGEARSDASRAGAQAMEALRSLTDDVIQRQMGRKTELDSEDRAFLERIAGYYEAFAALQGDAIESRRIRAEGQFRLALLRSRLGQEERAVEGFRVASALYGELAAERPEDAEYTRARGLAHGNIGGIAADRGRIEEARAELGRSIELLEAGVRAFPQNLEVARALATSQLNLGRLFEQLARWEEAEEFARLASRTLEPLVVTHPDATELLRELAMCHTSLGQVERRRLKAEEGIRSLERALRVLEKLVDAFPDRPEYRHDLAVAHNSSSAALADAGRGDDAVEELRTAIEIERGLAARFPAVPAYRIELTRFLQNLVVLLGRVSELREAHECANEAVQLARRLDAEFPGVPRHRNLLGGACDGLGGILGERGRLDEAQASLQEAIGIREGLVAAHPDAAEYVVDLAASRCNLGNLLNESLDRAADALPHYERAIDVLSTSSAVRPDHALAAEYLRNSHLGRALARQRLGRHEESLMDLARVIELSEGARRRHFQLAQVEWLVEVDPLRASKAAVELVENDALQPAENFGLACLMAKLAGVITDVDRRTSLEAGALALLERALAGGWFRIPESLARLRSEPLLAPLRTNARFAALLESAAHAGPSEQLSGGTGESRR